MRCRPKGVASNLLAQEFIDLSKLWYIGSLPKKNIWIAIVRSLSCTTETLVMSGLNAMQLWNRRHGRTRFGVAASEDWSIKMTLHDSWWKPNNRLASKVCFLLFFRLLVAYFKSTRLLKHFELPHMVYKSSQNVSEWCFEQTVSWNHWILALKIVCDFFQHLNDIFQPPLAGDEWNCSCCFFWVEGPGGRFT